MGTLIEVRVPDLPPAEAVEAIRCVRRRVEELEAAMTLYRLRSPLVALNSRPVGSWMEAPVELVDAVLAAIRANAATGGAYDPTVTPAVRAWGLYDLEGRQADPRVLAEWRSRPDLSAIEVSRAERRLRRLDPRMELDLGGIGKGIAVDESLAALRRKGSRAALVNLGGQIGVLGPPPDRPRGWPVGIAHPRRPGEICTEFDLRSGHVATSGDFERWVETPLGRKHHILDPATGESAAGVASLTVWAPTGGEADVSSTARFVQIARGAPSPATVPCYLIREREGSLFAEGTLRGAM
jgi:thiamine biosynthesis lipoprotein